MLARMAVITLVLVNISDGNCTDEDGTKFFMPIHGANRISTLGVYVIVVFLWTSR